MPTRHLHAVDTRYWHYRQQGDTAAETALILLHDLPRTSAVFGPLFAELGILRPKMRILAPDIPGLGGTEPLAKSPESMLDYVPSLRAFFREMGLRQIILYGVESGAQLAIAYANTYPDKVAHAWLDQVGHLTDADRQAMPTPDLTPRADGSHLTELWAMAEDVAQYVPWFMADEAHRISPPPLPEQTARLAETILSAGPAYMQAYRASIAHEQAENIQKLTVPTTIFQPEGGDIPPQLSALLAHTLPTNVQIVDVPANAPERTRIIAEQLVK